MDGSGGDDPERRKPRDHSTEANESGRPNEKTGTPTDKTPAPASEVEPEPSFEELTAAVEAEEAEYARRERNGTLPDGTANRPERSAPESEELGEAEKPEDDRGWKTVTEEIGEEKSWHSFSAAKRELGTVSGTELHHIVEQSQSKPTRSGFDVEKINSSDNLTRLDKDVHIEISRLYSRKPLGGTETTRDSLNGMSWEDQYEFGCRTLDYEMRRRRDSDD